MIDARLYHSLIPVNPETEPDGETLTKAVLCNNQPYSFQLAYKITDFSADNIDFYIRIESELPISLYHVNCVPMLHTVYSGCKPQVPIGLCPDILIPKQTNPRLKKVANWDNIRTFEDGERIALNAFCDSWQSLWICINENSQIIKEGNYSIKIKLYSLFDVELACTELEAEVLGVKLPRQRLMYTNWFHNDCLADYYGVELFSEKYFTIMEDYVKKAVINGMNMILVPAFTPPLDTPLNGERMTVQLVKAEYRNGSYSFDFSLMKKYIDICKRCGIKYFEHSHFFTQWGARSAPKIIVKTGDKEIKMFGWKTKATGKKYVTFLRRYITELKRFLAAEGLNGKMLFHISDEPGKEHIESYGAAKKEIADLLEGEMCGDAMFDTGVYEAGYCDMPIAMTAFIHRFIGKCENLWAYYIGSNCQNSMSNRLLQVSRERNRMLGVQLYYYKIKGFLQWGYNNYYGQLSQGFYEPYFNPCCGWSGCGSSYMVYPDRTGKALQSVRQKVFGDGLNDIRLLSLLEKLKGRKAAKAVIEKHFGKLTFNDGPDTAKRYIDFINDVYINIKNSLD